MIERFILHVGNLDFRFSWFFETLSFSRIFLDFYLTSWHLERYVINHPRVIGRFAFESETRPSLSPFGFLKSHLSLPSISPFILIIFVVSLAPRPIINQPQEFEIQRDSIERIRNWESSERKIKKARNRDIPDDSECISLAHFCFWLSSSFILSTILCFL